MKNPFLFLPKIMASIKWFGFSLIFLLLCIPAEMLMFMNSVSVFRDKKQTFAHVSMANGTISIRCWHFFFHLHTQINQLLFVINDEDRYKMKHSFNKYVDMWIFNNYLRCAWNFITECLQFFFLESKLQCVFFTDGVRFLYWLYVAHEMK